MEIIFYGRSCFLLKSKDIRAVLDPYSSEAGLNLPSGIKSDVISVSHQHSDHNNTAAISGIESDKKPFVISAPGEYEVNGVSIIGVPSFHDSQKGAERGKNTIFLYNLEEMGVCHLGDLGHSLSDDELNKLNQVDVLMVPVGGIFTIDARKAVEIINQIDPKIVIPMHYQDGAGSKLAPLENFVKEIGMAPEKVDMLKMVKANLPEEERKLIVFNKRG